MLGEVVNLRALSVYVRLVDLLDIADDRTPYALWKFVAPRDPTAKMEWAKHAALQPITCPKYQSGRIILVDGGTDNHEVYAALEDLRIWCEDQLRGCNDTLARMNDDRHRLDIFHIHWRVVPRGFKPVSIQFEFDRARMFDILGDEIYQGDPYVFLRELLQNSIDAIRTRRAVLERNGIAPAVFGAIHVNVEHGQDGDAVVTWQDDGIGMDEFVVRNYLAIAGKSYYHSEAFEREGLNIDPISRFGIGILSCFMVADALHIDTFRDPYLPGDGQPLRIKIPAPKKQFRIETRPVETASPGTTVKVFVKGEKLPRESAKEGGKEAGKPKPLDVTKYLSIVAGFVEFPIVITEGDRKTIVLHPYQDAEAAAVRFDADFEVHQLDLSYPWEKVFLPQDLHAAREVFEVHTLDMRDDLGLEGYEGKLLRFLPRPGVDLQRMSATEASAYRLADADAEEVRVRYYHANDLDRPGEQLARSARRGFTASVYRDGILLPNASVPAWLTPPGGRGGVPSRMVVNLPKSETPRVDLARTMIRTADLSWDAPIRSNFLQRYFDAQIANLCSLDPSERLLATARVAAYDLISVEELFDRFPKERWPILEISPDGDFRPIDVGSLDDRPLYSAPIELGKFLESSLRRYSRVADVDRSIMARWKGGSFCVPESYFNLFLLGDVVCSITRAAMF
ncbi:MAG: ATP-binding protein, partial [Planctomycetes bacterium]|nr:ATP-binding protein [Planctomycetota bacterium]